MSHEINSTDRVFTVGEQAWHGLDDNRKGPRLTADEAKAYLDWRVKKVPAKYEGKPVDGAFYTVREDTDAVLGVVGSQYSVIQNDWLFKLLEPVVDQGACSYETGGSLMGGRKVWALAKLPQAHYIVKDDRVDQYILVTIAHDGSLMFTALYTDVRVVCNKLYLGFEADINNLDPNHAHTAWSAYNAYTDLLDHDKPARKGTDRTNWSWFGPGVDKWLRQGSTQRMKGSQPSRQSRIILRRDKAAS